MALSYCLRRRYRFSRTVYQHNYPRVFNDLIRIIAITTVIVVLNYVFLTDHFNG